MASRDGDCNEFVLKGLQKSAAAAVQQQKAFKAKGEEQSEGFTRSISLYWHWVRGQKAASKMGKVGGYASRGTVVLFWRHQRGIRAVETAPFNRYNCLRPLKHPVNDLPLSGWSLGVVCCTDALQCLAASHNNSTETDADGTTS